MTRLSRTAMWALLVTSAAACGGTTPGTDMVVTKTDMASTDMTVLPPVLTIPAGCTVPGAPVTLASFYGTIIAAKCSTAGCHDGTTSPKYNPDAAAFRTNTVSKPAIQGMNFITPNNPDTSYILYKITNQQTKTVGGGGQMPLGSTPLSATDQCTLINWVRTGAT